LGITDVHGARYSIDPRDSVIGRLLFLEGSFDAEPVDGAVRVLEAAGLAPQQILDIGANIGTVTVELLRRYPLATAAAFEPDPDSCRLLRQNIAANDLLGRATVFPIALSDAEGIVRLDRSQHNLGDHRIRTDGGARPQGAAAGVTTLDVPARRLDELLRAGTITLTGRVLTKLDVQGHEGHVLAGGRPLLEHPLLVEFWPHGLRRSGGLDAFLEALETYSAVMPLSTEPREVGVDHLRAMSFDMGLGHVDLLALP
jgi:FkbM family methyltransferase